MILIRGLYNLKPSHKHCVITIGNFDGIHLGHQSLIKKTKAIAKKQGLKSTLMLFDPQPLEYFLKEKASGRLMRLREKIHAIRALGMDQIIVLRFNKTLANLSASDFVDTILAEKLGASHVVVGDDFRFGKDRQGDVALLRKKNITVEVVPTHFVDGVRVSSTAIREALKSDDLKRAGQFLGQPFTISGCVRHGKKQGRILGFPTANLRLHRENVPVWGVYVVNVVLKGTRWGGVANVGVRPTLDGTQTLLEVHLFNFNQAIYGQAIDVEFIHKLRGEYQFASVEALKNQIFKDAEQARQFLKAIL